MPLTIAEAQAVLAAAEGRRNGVRWAIALALGLRQGEALGLPWADIDFDAGTLQVRRALGQGRWRHGPGRGDPGPGPSRGRTTHRVGGGLIVGEAKSRAGKRTMSAPVSIIAALRAHRSAQAAERLAAGELWHAAPPGGLHTGTGWVSAPTGRVVWLDPATEGTFLRSLGEVGIIGFQVRA